MPRFYFHLRDEYDAPDEEGREFPDAAAAQAAAVREIRQLLCEQVRQGYLNLRHRIDLEDEVGQRLATVQFEEAIDLKI